VNKQNNLLLAFYGDDFTGSTDALEFLSRAGARTILFLEPPTAEQLSRYPDLDAFGVAGMTRSIPPEQMEKILLPAFKLIKQSGARHVHYKVCSTFDSSPSTGSIGKAIDCGAIVFENKFIPLLVAAPVLGRYCVFGNLFARMGIASNGNIYRLDRHPSMSKHPVTPADESDLRLHLSKQTTKKVCLLDILQFSKTKEEISKECDNLANRGAEVILIDALYQDQLLKIGELVDSYTGLDTLFSVGSSGIEMALGQYWNETNVLKPVTEWKDPGSVDSLLVISGSCSPVTAVQISYAKANGFKEIIVGAAVICENDTATLSSLVNTAVSSIKNGGSVIIHTNGTTKQNDTKLPAEKAGTVLGNMAKEIASLTALKRIVIAGGDTSSYAARAMCIESVEMIAALIPGAPLCKATAPSSPIDGVEINLKGGQVGAENYFEVLKRGKL
jgi:uncharacterized protein YgbK (DUF1537 family)